MILNTVIGKLVWKDLALFQSVQQLLDTFRIIYLELKVFGLWHFLKTDLNVLVRTHPHQFGHGTGFCNCECQITNMTSRDLGTNIKHNQHRTFSESKQRSILKIWPVESWKIRVYHTFSELSRSENSLCSSDLLWWESNMNITMSLKDFGPWHTWALHPGGGSPALWGCPQLRPDWRGTEKWISN